MLKLLAQLMFSFLSIVAVSAQVVVSTQGESYTNANGYLDFTIGEVVIETVINSNAKLTQGFHQSKWTVLGIEDNFPSFEVSIFPNPITSILNIRTANFKNVRYALYDVQGRLVAKELLLQDQTAIPLNEVAQGSYSLILTKGSQILKTFKLIKTN
jgi:hypothetical protein